MRKTLRIITEPNPILHEKSLSVTAIDDEVRSFMDDMLVAMYENKGIGLAAVQVGILKRIIVIDVEQEGSDGFKMPLFMVNAEIVKKSKEYASFPEGCLSVPNFSAEVMRPADITVRFINYNGLTEEIEVKNSLLSVCIQHEIDHTNGILFTDHVYDIANHR